MSVTLVQIQDLGACRAIVGSISDVEALAGIYRSGGSAHGLREDTSYIERPKPGGYRSHHFVLEFRATRKGEQVFDGRRIEVQIRTRLQHAWATTVEAVGLVRAEDLKAGQGNPDWLRLFALMSSEFAGLEGRPLVPDTGERAARHEEIKALNGKLGAIETLKTLNHAFKSTERIRGLYDKWFLIQFDRASNTVAVTGYNNPTIGSDNYEKAEYGNEMLNSVLVEVDKLENLRAAYPNYFLDVGEFTSHLSEIVHGKPLVFRKLDPIKTGILPPDLSWWKSRRSLRY